MIYVYLPNYNYSAVSDTIALLMTCFTCTNIGTVIEFKHSVVKLLCVLNVHVLCSLCLVTERSENPGHGEGVGGGCTGGPSDSATIHCAKLFPLGV